MGTADVPRRRLPGVAACVILVAGGAAALELPPEMVFRESIVTCDYVVVGQVVATDPIDPAVQERTSTLVVEETVWGSFAPGDHLRVVWRADRWYPEYPDTGLVTIVACGGGTQLTDLHGAVALWRLACRDDLLALWDPIVLSPENAEQITRFATIIEDPPANDMLLMRREREEDPWRLTAEDTAKLATVLDCLKTYLRELGAPGE